MTNLISRISYFDIFKTKVSESYLLPKINIEKSLETLALINKYEYKIHNNKNSDLNFILHEWLKDSSDIFKNNIINAYINYKRAIFLTNTNSIFVTIIYYICDRT